MYKNHIIISIIKSTTKILYVTSIMENTKAPEWFIEYVKMRDAKIQDITNVMQDTIRIIRNNIIKTEHNIEQFNNMKK